MPAADIQAKTGSPGVLHRPSDARELVFGKEIGGKMGKEAGLGR